MNTKSSKSNAVAAIAAMATDTTLAARLGKVLTKSTADVICTVYGCHRDARGAYANVITRDGREFVVYAADNNHSMPNVDTPITQYVATQRKG